MNQQTKIMVTTPETDGQEKCHYETGEKRSKTKLKDDGTKNWRQTVQQRRQRRQRIRQDGSNDVGIARKKNGRKEAKALERSQKVLVQRFGKRKLEETACTRQYRTQMTDTLLCSNQLHNIVRKIIIRRKGGRHLTISLQNSIYQTVL